MNTIVSAPCGVFEGILQDGIRIFRGIRYARYDRFKEAERIEFKDGVYDATQFGTVCPQRSCRLAEVIGEEKGSVIEEGSLMLSIYTPENAQNLPVMVWIHGGSYQTGGSEDRRYSGRRLVRAGNVIVVKISYRLGVFGYLWHPDVPANLGLKDQMLSLQWIRDNIASFGGDPQNVTLFGQSAGGHSVASLVAVSEDKPLFSKVILQSPPLGKSATPSWAERMTRKFTKILGKDPFCATLSQILDAQEVMRKCNSGLPFMPIIPDVMAVPDCIRQANVKFMIGYAAQDASPFLVKPLGRLYDTWIGQAFLNYATKSVFAAPVETYANKIKGLGLSADVYRIDWYPQGSRLKACHCIELPFILGFYDDWRGAKMLDGLDEEEFDRISEVFLKVWTDFAREGKSPDLLSSLNEK